MQIANQEPKIQIILMFWAGHNGMKVMLSFMKFPKSSLKLEHDWPFERLSKFDHLMLTFELKGLICFNLTT